MDLYDASVPVFKNGLIVLKNILTKAIEHYGINTSEEIMNATLIEDLIPLPRHVQMASNIAKKSLVRITGRQVEVWDDNEDTAEKLIERCDKTLAFLDTFKPSQVNGCEENRVRMEMIGSLEGNTFDASAKEYLFSFGIPFFFFHLQLVYSMLRMKGVVLGSADFLMPYVEHYFEQKN